MKLHPLSVPYRAIAGSISIGAGIVLATVVGSGADLGSGLFLGTVAVYLTASILYQVAYYRRFEYDLSEGSVDITSGVFNRRDREIPLRRIQNVDVSQNPVQRAMGIAALQIETAGGGDTEAALKYVSTDEARRLRTELRRLAREDAGEGEAPDATDDTTVEAGPADGDLVFALPNRNLLLLSLFTIDPGAGVVSSLFGAVVSGGDPENLAGIGAVVEYLPGGQVEAVLFGVAVLAVLTWLLSVVLTFARYYGFELRRTRDGLEYERGLLQRFSGTIPLEKVQTVSLRENVLKRRFGYATVAVETAGYSPGQSTRGRQLAVPLADRGRAVDIARSIEPFEDVDVRRPPRRARRRYLVRYAAATVAFAAVVLGAARWFGVFGRVPTAYWIAVFLPLAATPVAAHYAWIHRGYRTEEGHFVARSGFWRRVTRVVPYYRVQTVVDSRTVFQRRRTLASVTADTASSASIVGGDATAIDVDAGDADDLRERLRERLQERLREERLRDPRSRRGGPVPDRTNEASGTDVPPDANADRSGAGRATDESDGNGRGTDAAERSEAGRATDEGDGNDGNGRGTDGSGPVTDR